MLPRSRHEKLLSQLQLRGSLRSSDIATLLGVSEVTIRRDVVELAAAGLLVKVHGGAIAVDRPREPSVARTLAGIVVPSSSAYFPEVIRGAEDAARASGVRLVLGVSAYQQELERVRIERLLALGVEGMLVTPSSSEQQHWATGPWLEHVPVPVVVLERDFTHNPALRELDHVRTDHAYGAMLAVQHFAALGHRKVALAVFDVTPTARWIRRGHAEAMTLLDVAPGPDVSLPKGESDPGALDVVLGHLVEDCQRTGTRAVLVHSDFHAARLVEIVLERGLRVPSDLAIVSYDDENADLAQIPLTAITPPRRELGREGLRLLVRRLRAPAGSEPAPRHVNLLPKLTVRDSCGARAAAAI